MLFYLFILKNILHFNSLIFFIFNFIYAQVEFGSKCSYQFRYLGVRRFILKIDAYFASFLPMSCFRYCYGIVSVLDVSESLITCFADFLVGLIVENFYLKIVE